MISEDDKQFLTVGYKKTLRMINSGSAAKVFLAEDCDYNIKSSVETAAANANAALFYVKTMRELGRMCDIEVGASCAAVSVH